MNEDDLRLWQAFEAASARLKAAATNSMVGNASRRRGIEANYGLAYQHLVRAGLAPQLKGKYR